jgi:predicted transcriptional regulator
MASLLPKRTKQEHEAAPECISLIDSDEVFEALSSETARKILTGIHEEPTTASTLADQVGTSVQNVQYHLKQLQAADLVETIDTWYSSKGREMSVYGPSNQPLVMIAGNAFNEEELSRVITD